MSRPIGAMAAELILAAEKKGVLIDMDYALRYIDARQRITSHPEDAVSPQVVKHFEMLLSPFGRFMLPDEDWLKHCEPLVEL